MHSGEPGGATGGWVTIRRLWSWHHSSTAAAQAVSAGRTETREPAGFFRKHQNYLRFPTLPDGEAELFARSIERDAKRLLLMDDHVPLRRSAPVYPVQRSGAGDRLGGVEVTDVSRCSARRFDPTAMYADFPETVEGMHDRSSEELGAIS